MTIIIPTWLVVVILCLFVIRTLVFLKRGATMIKGIKTAWPFIKEFLSSKKSIKVEVTEEEVEGELVQV